MFAKRRRTNLSIICLFFALAFVYLMPSPVLADGYGNALKGVDSYDAVFEVTRASPKVANIVFWAVKNAYEVAEVKAEEEVERAAVAERKKAREERSGKRSR